MKNIQYTFMKQTNTIELLFQESDTKVIIDIEQLVFLLNSKKLFSLKFEEKSDYDYPYYTYNENKINIFEYLYKSRGLDVTFKDNNKYNLTPGNIYLTHPYDSIIKKTYTNANYVYSHINTRGRDALYNKNPIWRISNNFLCMLCEPKTLVYIDNTSFEKIKKMNVTFFLCNNGYIAGRYNNKQYYLHQLLMDCYGNGKGTSNISVDHIDRNPLNNCYDNLRIVDSNTQQQNTKGIIKGTKRARKKSARELPEGLTQEMLEKYVVYYRECYNINKQLYREFFKVEKHPKLEKIWTSSKSNKISILDKLETANKIVRDLEKDVYPDHSNKKEKEKENDITHSLPKYVSLRIIREKPCLVFEKRITKEDGTKDRYSLKHSFMNYPKNNEQLKEPLDILINKVKEKYDIQL